MVGEVLSDTWKVGDGADSERAQLPLFTNSRTHQDGGRMNCACRQDDRAAFESLRDAGYRSTDGDRATAIELDTIDQRVSDNFQVRPCPCRLQVRIVCSDADPVAGVGRTWINAARIRGVDIFTPARSFYLR